MSSGQSSVTYISQNKASYLSSFWRESNVACNQPCSNQEDKRFGECKHIPTHNTNRQKRVQAISHIFRVFVVWYDKCRTKFGSFSVLGLSDQLGEYRDLKRLAVRARLFRSPYSPHWSDNPQTEMIRT